jgi:hypothetical protein
MNVQPFFRVAAGAVVTPEIPSAAGNYTISNEPGGKSSSSFPGADRVVSGKFWPLNGTTAALDPLRNMLTISLNPLTTSTTHPHNYWVCYGGWNSSGLDPDGQTVVGTSRPPVLLSMYNRTPYIMMWGMSDSLISDPASLNTGLRLMPGACLAFDGSPQPVYYLSGGTHKYDTLQGVAKPGAFLHVKCLSTVPAYDRTTAAPFNGYLELVVAQAAVNYWTV